MTILIPLLYIAAMWTANAEPKKVRVFVALCDNKTQGIVPVGEKIGNGDDAEANLYWGCSDGFGSLFKRSSQWTVVTPESDVSTTILRRLSLRHAKGDIELTAEAYRGSQIKRCVSDFEAAATGGKYHLVAFIGHNGLMDFQLEPPIPVRGHDTDVIVLCCLSEKYFGERLRKLHCKPILMTQQLMYPGAFLMEAALQRWRVGGSPADLRAAAAAAYARNQKISVRAAIGVFAPPARGAQTGTSSRPE